MIRAIHLTQVSTIYGESNMGLSPRISRGFTAGAATLFPKDNVFRTGQRRTIAHIPLKLVCDLITTNSICWGHLSQADSPIIQYTQGSLRPQPKRRPGLNRKKDVAEILYH
jgi:hypothetical protein